MIDETMGEEPMGGDAGAGAAEPDGGNPDQMIGYIPEQYPAKDKTYLAAARAVLLNDQTATLLKKMLATSKDPTVTLAALLGKTVDAIETKLGPLTDDEHDRVCLVIAGWLASTMQKLGMPGLDDAGARQDFMGRILQNLSGGAQGEPAAAPGPEQAPAAAPMGQFAGGG